MNESVIRRLDDLGRIVIPKEIRKKLKLNVGDFLSVESINKNIVLSKYSIINEYDIDIYKMVKIIETLTDNIVLVTDKEKVLLTDNNHKKEYYGKQLSDEFLDIIIKSKEVSEEKVLKKVTVEDTLKHISYITKNIRINGYNAGIFIILSYKETLDIQSVVLANFASEYLSK